MKVLKEYKLGDMKVTEYEQSKLSCKEGGGHAIRSCMTRPPYCIYCKHTEFEILEDFLNSPSVQETNLDQTESVRESLDDFME